jgi:hypothetical protein
MHSSHPISTSQPPNSHRIHPSPTLQIRFLTPFPNLLNLLFNLLVLVVIILARVRNFVFQDLDKLVEDDGNYGTRCGTNPVDPVFCVEDASYYAGAEGACGIERAACVVDAY